MRLYAYFSHLYRRGIPRMLLLGLCALLITLVGCGTDNGQTFGVTMVTTSPGSGGSLNVASQPTMATLSPTPAHSAASMPALLPPGAVLPTEAQCAARVHHSSFEPRPQNTQANHSVPTAQQVAGLTTWGASMGQSSQADRLRKQITGNFTGTTDEILQWTACKWGVDPNLVRAQAVVESFWKQSTQGDLTTDQNLCPPGTWNGKSCYQSYGILQIKYFYFKSAWPMSRADTAFSAEYVYGLIRACYEGYTTYLNDRTPLPGYPRYHAGDIWGCLGRWFSGSWYDQGAVNYIQKVKATLASKTWLKAGF